MSAPPVGLCTWSLRPRPRAEQAAIIREQLGLGVVHLGLFDGAELADRARRQDILRPLSDHGLSVWAVAVAGEYDHPELAAARLRETELAADLAAELRCGVLTTHIGHLPADAAHPGWGMLVTRVGQAADACAARGLKLGMETGLNTPEQVLAFLADLGRPNVGVNFDPANFLIYGTLDDPIRALSSLREHVVGVHVKDAVLAGGGGHGHEVPLGQGDVDVPRYISKVRAIGYDGPLIIEQELRDASVATLQEAIRLVQDLFE